MKYILENRLQIALNSLKKEQNHDKMLIIGTQIELLRQLIEEFDKEEMLSNNDEPQWFEGHYNSNGDWVEGYFR